MRCQECQSETNENCACKRGEVVTGACSRREALLGAASLGVLGAVAGTAVAADGTVDKPTLKKRSVIVFQGDSITDAGRDKKNLAPNDAKGLGRGYAAMAAGELLGAYPERELKIYNRGISGNKIPDLEKRWQADCIDLKPDVLSILIGVNDLWHTFAFGSKYKGTIADYETGFRKLIERTQKEVPGVRIVICEAFTTRTSKEFEPLAEYRAVANKLAAEKGLTLVPFQALFDEAVKAAEAKFWLWDGIHPSIPGHALMARKWRDVVGL